MTTTEAKLYEAIAMTETAAEDLSALSKSIPKSVCATVNQALGKSVEVERLEKAAKLAEQAAAKLRIESQALLAKVKHCALIAGALAIAIPVTPCVLAYLENRKLNANNARLYEQVARLHAMAEKLAASNPERIELVRYKGGAFGLVFPIGMRFSHTVLTEDKREMVIAENQ